MAAESIVAAQTPDTGCCHADEYGLLDLRCLWALLAAEERAYARGFREGMESVRAGIEADVAQVVGNAARSLDVAAARRRPYTIPRWAS